MLIDYYQPTIIPVFLIALAGWFIMREDTDRASRRFLLFLLWMGVLLLLAIFLIAPRQYEPDNRFAFELPMILMPALIGIFVLIPLNLKRLQGLETRARVVVVLLLLAIIILLGLLWTSRLEVPSMVLPGVFILLLLWSLGWRFSWVPEALGLTALGTLLFFDQTLGIRATLPMWVNIPFAILFFLTPIFLVIAPALFLTQGLQQLSTDEKVDTKKLSRRRTVFRALFAFTIFIVLNYTAFWGGVWDQTADMGFGFMFSPFGSVAGLVAGLVMTMTLHGKYRLAGLLYIIIIPSLLLRTYDAGMDISHHALTDQRAEQIAQALQQFHAREGHYPETLQELTPRDLLYIPKPIILLGQDWCYQGNAESYRLGAIYREYWSLPLSLRIYASVGEPPVSAWECDARLAELKKQHDPPPFTGIPETAPTPVPLPTSVITAQRKTVQPILRARAISTGAWSPNGKYLILGISQIVDEQTEVELSFLDAETGRICPAGDRRWSTNLDDGVREHFAWLPDGRLLYVPASGDVTLLSPCEPDSAPSTFSHPVTFTHALDYHAPSGRVLLKNQESFWVLDGNSMEVTPIPNVTPNPYELHWDRFAWSPAGTRLAISRLNGQTAEEGSTLFVVDATTGIVENEFPFEIASDQSAPRVEWLSEDELLLHGSGALLLIDFRAEPPHVTDVLRDIFLLDISYPDDISTFAWEGEHLSVRVNHPRNQGIYVYHPETGQVEIVQPKDASPLFFFPNGEMVEMANYLAELSEDKYELIWVDAPDTVSRLITVQGHLPRNYPNLFPHYLPATSQLAFGSSQGVSLVSIPDGETVGFWELAGGGSFSISVLPPSGYPVLVVLADGDGLYYIPLP